MNYKIVELIAVLTAVLLVIYGQFSNPNNRPEGNGFEAQTLELRQIRKQLEKANNLFAAFIVQFFTKLNEAINENESLRQKVNETATQNTSLEHKIHQLEERLVNVESERDEAKAISTRLSAEKVLLEQEIEQLESHKKVLIQELGGSLSSPDIELVTWEFLIQKVKIVTKQLNEVRASNQSLTKINKDLNIEKDDLTKKFNQIKNTNIELIQDILQLKEKNKSLDSKLKQTLDKIQPLERTKDKLEQEKAQLKREIYELNKLGGDIVQAEAKVNQLEKLVKEIEEINNNLEVELKEERAKTTSLAQRITDMVKAKDQLNIELQQEKSKVISLEQKIQPLEEYIKKLSLEIKQEQTASFKPTNKNSEEVTNILENSINEEISKAGTVKEEFKDLTTDANRDRYKDLINKNYEGISIIMKLKQKIKQLEEKIEEIENPPTDIQYYEESLLEEYQESFVEEYQESLLEQYADLVYYVQMKLRCSGIEELDKWEKTEEFCIELISRLCFINTILVTQLKLSEDNSYDFYMDTSYPGKVLYWTNIIRWELSSFFNSKF